MLRFHDDYSESETAEIMSCSPDAVFAATQRGLRRLQQLAPEIADSVQWWVGTGAEDR